MKNRLQFRHDNKLYSSLDEIKNALEKSSQYSLYGEPTVFKYGNSGETNLVLVIGNSGSSTDTGNKDYTIIDINNLSKGSETGSTKELVYYKEDIEKDIAKINADTIEFISQGSASVFIDAADAGIKLSQQDAYLQVSESAIEMKSDSNFINTKLLEIKSENATLNGKKIATEDDINDIIENIDYKQDKLLYLNTDNGYDFDFSGNTGLTLSYNGNEVATAADLDAKEDLLLNYLEEERSTTIVNNAENLASELELDDSTFKIITLDLDSNVTSKISSTLDIETSKQILELSASTIDLVGEVVKLNNSQIVTENNIGNLCKITKDIIYTGDSETKESDYITFAESGSTVTDAMQKQTDELIDIITRNEFAISTAINGLNDNILVLSGNSSSLNEEVSTLNEELDNKQDNLEYLNIDNGYDFNFSGDTGLTLSYNGIEVATLNNIEDLDKITKDIIYTGDSETKESDYITFAVSGSTVTDAMQKQTDELIKIIVDNEFTASTAINKINEKIDEILERLTVLEEKVNS